MDHGLVNRIISTGVLREEWQEYRLVIPADEPVSRQVKQLRMQWEQLYGESTVSDKPPCITLACFMAREEMEDMVMRWLNRICNIQQSFMVTLNNFSAVPPQTIYIRVQDTAPFIQLASQLRLLDDFSRPADGRKWKIFDKPFIKLGSLPEHAEQQQWFTYTHQVFHAAFMARKILLVKRETNNWKTLSVFPFQITDCGLRIADSPEE
jgi:hypothetical protein